MMNVPRLAYGGISLANGGLEAALRRERRIDEQHSEARRVEFVSFLEDMKRLGVSLPDQEDLGWMVARRELTIPEARELMQATLDARPWYGR